MKRFGSTRWNGDLRNGKGAVSTESRALENYPYSSFRRYGEKPGTNPEELLGAESTFKERLFLDKKDPNLLHDVITVFDHALTRPNISVNTRNSAARAGSPSTATTRSMWPIPNRPRRSTRAGSAASASAASRTAR
jgi:hypothetical protein